MRSINKFEKRIAAKPILKAAASFALEQMESRVMLSGTVLAAWNFNNDPSTGVLTSPPQSSGIVTGTAYSVGMQATNAGGYLYPATGATAGSDASATLSASGNADSGGGGGSEDGSTGWVWRVQSGQNSNAPIASQGAQFGASTVGQTGISVQFDIDPSSIKAEAQFIVEYNPDITNPAGWVNCTQLMSFGPNDTANTQGTVPTLGNSSSNSVWIQNNPSVGGNPNIAVGNYATITGPIVAGSNTSWLNDLVVDLSNITAVNGQANFGFRVVNAATGAAETNVSGVAAFKNWRFDDVQIIANGAALSAPTISPGGNPTNQSVSAGQSVSFTAAASGNPTPTVQWYEGTVGSGTLISGATSTTLTFTTASSASDNGTTYYAVFTNTKGSVSTTAATLSDALAGPVITQSPSSISVGVGDPATFTATATGSPTPTVQWWVNQGSGFIQDTTDSGYNTGTLTVSPTTAAENGYIYEAIFSNSQNSATSNPATLTVISTPIITQQPASQTVAAGATVSMIAAAVTNNTPLTVKWQINTGSGFTDILGATSPAYIFQATESLAGDRYRAVFTNPAGSVTTTAATLTVAGTPITQWNFTTGQAATPGGSTAPGSGNSPLPTTAINSGNSVQVLGLVNDDDGLPSFPEADVIPIASSVDSNINEYVWRVRGGGGSGPTGSPGTPDGWSQSAPQGNQGVQFNVNTTGYSDVTLNFDWTQGAIGDMQAQYYDGSQWQNVGVPVQATGTDFYGVTPITTTTSAYTFTAGTSATFAVASSSGFYFDEPVSIGGINATVTSAGSGMLTVLPTASGTAALGATVGAVKNPTGVTINLQGISYANNNPNLQVRLVSVYDPALPNISDGNTNPGVPVSHGQYAGGFGSANDIQVIEMNDSNNFTLTLGAQTTATITYSANPTTMAANIQAALVALSNVGAGNVSVSSSAYTTSPFYVPPGPITAYQGYSITFSGALKGTPEPTMTATGTTDGITTWQTGSSATTASTTTTAPFTVTAQQPLTLSVADNTGFTVGYPILLDKTITCLITSVGSGTITVTPETSGSVVTGAKVEQLGVTGFVDGGGSWELGNISFNGDVIGGAPGISSSPLPITVGGGFAATFTATAYSETLPTVQWQFNDGTGWQNVTGGTVTPPTFTLQSSNSYTSTYSFTADSNRDQNGFQYRAVFSNGNGSSSSQGALITVVAPQAPYVLIQPQITAVQAGGNFQFTTYGTALPTATVQWQYLSTAPGAVWTNLTDSASVAGSQTNTVTITAASNTSQNGYQYRALFTNDVGSTPTNAVPLTVLPTETVLTDWDFNANNNGTTYINSPTPVAAGVDGSVAVTGAVASGVGMNLAYNPSDPATGTVSPGAVNADDVQASSSAVIDGFSENVWRIRGGPTATSGGSPANGWSNFVSQGTQGVQFSVPTTGYSNVYVTMDWLTTHSGEQNAQRQYTLDGGTTWVNLGSQLSLYAPGNDDFYGDSTLGGVVPVVFDLSSVPGAANNPNFGIRLVNSYNLVLSNEQTIALTDSVNGFSLSFGGNTTGTINYNPANATMAGNIQSALAALPSIGANNVMVNYDPNTGLYDVILVGTLGTTVQPGITMTTSGTDTISARKVQYANAQPNLAGNPYSSVPYNGSKGNWEFGNIVFHGDPTWLDPNSVASWNEATQTLTVSGPTTITSDPNTSLIANNNPALSMPQTFVASNDEPMINATGAGATLTIAPIDGSLNVHVGGLSLLSGATADIKYAGLTPWGFTNKETLIVGPAGNNSVPTFSVNSAAGSSINVENNAITINYGLGNGGTDPYSNVNTYLTTGYHADAWNGGGLSTSDGTYLLGLGSTDTGSQVKVVFTVNGDANLDGLVDFRDLLTLATDYSQSGANWAQGDFNFDGSVNFSDLLTVATNYSGTAANPAAAPTPNFNTLWATAQSDVTPKPAPTPAPVATHLVFIEEPAKVVAGRKIPSKVEVAVEDASGHIVKTDNSTVTLTIAKGPKGAHITGTAKVKVVNGVATFSNLSLSKLGKYTLTAIDGSLTAAQSAQIAAV